MVGMLISLGLTFVMAVAELKGWLWLLGSLTFLWWLLGGFGLYLHHASSRPRPIRLLHPRQVKEILWRRETFWSVPNMRLLTTRLEALETLIVEPNPDLLPLALPYLASPNAHLKTLAGRAVGRCVAQLSPEQASVEAWRVAQELIKAYETQYLSRYVLVESLLLMGQNSDEVLRRLLGSMSSRQLFIALLDAPNPWPIPEAMEHAVAGLDYPDPEVQAVSLRYFSKALTVPDEARFKVLEFLQSPTFFVRVQALKVTPLLGERIALEVAYKALADENWWVRKRAATVLHSLDRLGIEALEYAREHHYDAFGRDTAANELLEVELEKNSNKETAITLL